MRSALNSWTSEPGVAPAAVIAVFAAATLVGAWIFQYGFGLAPCPLCLQQRWPYYATIPLAALVAVAAAQKAPRKLLAVGFALIALIMLVGAGLAGYHAGVEWQWWAGPQDCSAAGTSFSGGAASDLLRRMGTARVVRCDEAAWRFLGLSLAGWNVLISLSLAGVALLGLAQMLGFERRRRSTWEPRRAR